MVLIEDMLDLTITIIVTIRVGTKASVDIPLPIVIEVTLIALLVMNNQIEILEKGTFVLCPQTDTNHPALTILLLTRIGRMSLTIAILYLALCLFQVILSNLKKKSYVQPNLHQQLLQNKAIIPKIQK